MDIMEMERTAREAMADGDLKKSRDIYIELIALMPQNPVYFTFLGEVYQRLGKATEAQRCRAAAGALMNPQPAQFQQSVPPQAPAMPVETNTKANIEHRARFCWKCGSPVEEFNNFCGKCGAGPDPIPASNDGHGLSAGNALSVGHTPPPTRHAMPGPNGFLFSLTAILIVVSITLGIFYGINSDRLKKADKSVTTLETNVTALETELSAETASADALQVNLARAQSDLNDSQSKVTSLSTDLTAANAAVTSTQANLDKAASDLAAAVLSNTAQAATLKKLQDPRHFDSVSELTGWLAKDDTNTNPAYSSLSSYSKAFILQVKALRDGYLLPACMDWDASYIYTWNAAVAGGIVYSIDPTTDVITKGPAFSGAPPSHPLPLP